MAEPIPVEELRNIEPETAAKLRQLGLKTDADIRKHGVAEVYATLKVMYPHSISINALTALQGALMDVDWREVPSMLADDLKREAWEIIRAHKAEQKGTPD